MKMAAEEMLMIRPLRCCRIWGTTALLASHTPRTLTAISSSHSAWLISQKGFIVMVEKIAALLTRMSRRPNWRTVVATISRQLVSSATSVRTKMAWPTAARHSPAPALPLASVTRAPFALGRFRPGPHAGGPLLDEPMGVRASDSLAGTGDDSDPILELHRR